MNDTDNSSEVEQIGGTAGKVWKLLQKNGPTRMPDIIKNIDAPRDRVMQAIGWLARENKIVISAQSRSRVVELAD